MTSSARAKGRLWEDEAACLVRRHGLSIVTRGYCCRGGELDLICRDADEIVVIEVRARRSSSHGTAAATVDVYKQRKIIFATRHFLMRHPDLADAPVRFDVITVDGTDTSAPQIQWIRNAFTA